MLKSKFVSGSFGTSGKAFSWFLRCFYLLISFCANKVIKDMNWPKEQQLVGLVV